MMKMSSLFVLLWAFCPIRLLEISFVPQQSLVFDTFFCLIRVYHEDEDEHFSLSFVVVTFVQIG